MSAADLRGRLLALGFVAAAATPALVLRRERGWLWVEPLMTGRWALRGQGRRTLWGLTADEAWERVQAVVGLEAQ